MNVGIVVGRFPVLSESFIIRLLEALDQSDMQLTVYALNGFDAELLKQLSPTLSERIASGGIRLKCLGAATTRGRARKLALFGSMAYAVAVNPLRFLKLRRKGLQIRQALNALIFAKLSAGSKHEIIHCQFMTVAVPVVASRNLIGSGAGCAITSYARGYDVCKDGAVNAEELKLLNSADGLCGISCVSRSLADRVLALGFNHCFIDVIYSGIPTSDFNFCASRSTFEKHIKFVQIGRMVDKKGHDLSLSMLSMMPAACTLDIVGDGPRRLDLQKQAAALGIIDRVRFHGSLSHARSIAIMSECHFMLIPSRTAANGDSEGIPNVVKEAMALGLICIGSDHSGIPEMIVAGDTGFIFKEDDLDSLVQQAAQAIARNADLERMAHNARQLVEKSFDSAKTTEAISTFYSRAIASDRLRRHISG